MDETTKNLTKNNSSLTAVPTEADKILRMIHAQTQQNITAREVHNNNIISPIDARKSISGSYNSYSRADTRITEISDSSRHDDSRHLTNSNSFNRQLYANNNNRNFHNMRLVILNQTSPVLRGNSFVNCQLIMVDAQRLKISGLLTSKKK